MLSKKIDINVDLGEGIGNESQLMPYIASCNIACGGHAGDFATMTTVVKLAKQYGVKIGAHPSFPDRENFGRKPMNMPYSALFISIKSQVDDLFKVLDKEKELLHHVKPHGALYNMAAVDKQIANTIIEVVKSLELPIKLYVPFGSVIADLANQEGVEVAFEVFADRNYNDDLTLVSRDNSNAVLHDNDEVFEHVFRMLSTQKVKTISGVEIPIKADTFCVHGDNPDTVILIKNLIEKLEWRGYEIK